VVRTSLRVNFHLKQRFDKEGELLMSAIVFLLLCISCMVFLILLSRTLTDEFRMLFVRVTELIPQWDPNHADLKGFAFCIAILLFIFGLAIVVFR